MTDFLLPTNPLFSFAFLLTCRRDDRLKDPVIYVFLKFKKVIMIRNTYLKGKKV